MSEYVLNVVMPKRNARILLRYGNEAKSLDVN